MNNSHVGFRRVSDMIIISIIILHTPSCTQTATMQYGDDGDDANKQARWAYSMDLPIVEFPRCWTIFGTLRPPYKKGILTSCDEEKKSLAECEKLVFSPVSAHRTVCTSYTLPRSILCISIRFWTLSSLNRGRGGGEFSKINRNDLLNAAGVDSSSSSSFDYLVPTPLHRCPLETWGSLATWPARLMGKTTRIHAVRRVGRMYCTVCRVVWTYHSLPYCAVT